MNPAIRTYAFPLVILAVFTGYFWWGTSLVPFHPDESTYLYMSGDLEALLSQPLSLAWSPSPDPPDKQRYRALDAPFTRYLLGVGRSLAGLPPLEVDWDWAATWEENLRAGAVPGQALLIAGRLAVVGLLPATLILTYLCALHIGGRASGYVAALCLATHTLTLLHTRRAMAEGALIFAVVFFLFSLTRADRQPWLVGLSAAVAFNAKQSALALLPIGVVAVLWSVHPGPGRVRALLGRAGVLLAVFALVTLALNPLYWRHPSAALRGAWSLRQDLVQRQVADSQRLAPGSVSATLGERALVLAANLYITPPSFSEVGNYRAETAASETRYLSIPGHNLFRGLSMGGLFMAATLFGVIVAVRRLWGGGWRDHRLLTLFLLASMAQAGALVVLIPLSWQRYVVPLVPLEGLWIGYGAGSLWRVLRAQKSRLPAWGASSQD